MKKITLFSFLLAIIFSLSFNDSNGQAYQNGDINVGAGIGFGSTLVGNRGLPIAIHLEKGFSDAISAGLYTAFASYNYSYWKYSYFIIGVRGAYHFGGIIDIPSELDLYGGLMLFYQNVNIKTIDNDIFGFRASSPGSVGLGAYIGARYYFTDNIGAYVELGNGIAWFQLGATFKF